MRGLTGETGDARSGIRRAVAALGVLSAFALIGVGCTGRPPDGGGTTTTRPPATIPGTIGLGASWTMWGKDLDNSHYQNAERTISPTNVGQLKPKWVAELKGDISATPTVADGTVYIPDWGGYLSALDARTGAVRWQKKVSDYVGFPTYFSRTAPAIFGSYLILGLNTRHSHGGLLNPGGQHPTTTTAPGGPTTTAAPDHHGNTGGDDHGADDHSHGGGDDHHGNTGGDDHGADDHSHGGEDQSFEGAWVIAVNRTNGNLVWKKQVDPQMYAVITGNPVVRSGRVVVGVSSNEWDFTAEPGFPCCTFRGSVVSLDAFTGRILWQTFTIPESKVRQCDPVANKGDVAKNCGLSGGSVWSTPAIDPLRNTVFVGTGQNYTVPDAMRQCVIDARAAGRPDAGCDDPENHFDSVLAIDFFTGRLKWSKKVLPYDPWNAGCVIAPGVGNCPEPFGPDADLGSSPNLYTALIGGRLRAVVGSGQKSGTYWALDRDTGQEVWHTDVGPGSTLGGIEWGTAVDNTQIYAPIANPYGTPYRAPDGTPLTRGSWAALDKATGQIKWQVANPGTGVNSSLGSPAVANGVMFGSGISATGDTFFALNAATGAKLWSFPSGGSSISSPAIVNGTVYWGTGYSHLEVAGATPSNKFYAFTVGGV